MDDWEFPSGLGVGRGLVLVGWCMVVVVVVVDVVEIMWAVVVMLGMMIRCMVRRGLVRVRGGWCAVVRVVEWTVFFWFCVVVVIIVIIIIIIVIEFIVFRLFVVLVDFPCFSC